MFRRTFLITSSATLAIACDTSTPASSHDVGPPPDLEVVVIDPASPFRTTGVPYFEALRAEGLLPADGVDVLALPAYGRENGAMVEHSLVAVAPDRDHLAAFFDGLPGKWQLPPSHALAFGEQRWPDGIGPLRWGARVVQTTPAIVTQDIMDVSADADCMTVRLDREGAETFEAMTADNIGQRLAIIVDDQVVADPVINARIPGGLLCVSTRGGWTSHRMLADRLRHEPGP